MVILAAERLESRGDNFGWVERGMSTLDEAVEEESVEGG